MIPAGWTATEPFALCIMGRRAVDRVHTARGVFGRLFGLMGRRGLARGEALWFPRCRSIHTCWMRFPIDVLFVDREGRIVRRYDGLKPWRFAFGGASAYGALEMGAGWLTPDAQPGARLEAVEMDDSSAIIEGLGC